MLPHIIDRWDAAIGEYPDLVALELAGETVTYRELGRRVDAVVARLSGPGPRVGVCVGKSLAGPVAYLAALVSGRAAVPMSPQAPAARVAAIIAAAGVTTVLTDGAATPDAAVAVIDARDTDNEPGDRPPRGTEAYVLFTSGSTGTPKGVRIPHTAVASYLDHVLTRTGIGPGSRLTHNFELTFDPSVFDLLAGLTSGATLVIPDAADEANPVAYVTGRRITHWYSVPSVISVARAMRLLSANAMPGLVHSGFIGEPLSLEAARAWAAAAPGSRIENVYGPTELTVSCTEYLLPPDTRRWPLPANGTVPIGAPYPDLDWCLVDNDSVVSDDGELCMRGPQRLTSYLDPGDNVGRFFSIESGVARDYAGASPVPEGCWYRTGDRIRIEDGLMIHLGRLDRQVKVRGYRIELGEVEHHVRTLERVVDAAAVIADSRTGRTIVVYYTGVEQPPYELRRYLAGSMPGYMMPERFVHVDDLPRNDRGKTDYRRLEALVDSSQGGGK